MPDCRLVSEGVLYVVAKEPREGEVKTRLSPPLTPAQACRCHRAFVEDSLSRFSRLSDIALRLAVTPDHDAPILCRMAADRGLAVEAQGEGSLGERMARVLSRGVGQGYATVVVGSDSPDLPLPVVGEAFESLGRHDVVIGPSGDGGYYLIGCRGEVPPVFALSAAWGGPDVFEETMQRLRRHGAAVAVMPTWSDVDLHSDLLRLAGGLRASAAAAAELPATSALLAELRTQGVDL